MSTNKYDVAVFLGRFQPYHLAHSKVIEHALTLADKVIIIIGSANKLIDYKNPWTAEERQEMIEDSLSYADKERVYFNYVSDNLYKDGEWVASVNDAVDAILMQYTRFRVHSVDPKKEANICLVGYEKDKSSYYLKMFPLWNLESSEGYSHHEGDIELSATMIRNMLYNNRIGYAKGLLPSASYDYIIDWIKNKEIDYLGDYHSAYEYTKAWYDFNKKYQQPYEQLPYGTVYYCTDNVVFQNKFCLLIKRKSMPGAEAFALPGGFINVDEDSETASIRELLEETHLKVPMKVLKGSCIGSHIFDHPSRSLRGQCDKVVGRTISHSFCYNLTDGTFPRIKAGDDAKEVHWLSINEIRKMKHLIFEDHYDQIEYFYSRI